MNNKVILLNKKPNKHYLYLLLIFLIFILILICTIHDFDSYKVVGLKNSNDTNKVSITIPYNKIDIFDYKLYVLYKNQKHYITDIKYGEVVFEDNVPFINVELTLDFDIDTEVVNFKILYNKERIIKKIIRIVKEE